MFSMQDVNLKSAEELQAELEELRHQLFEANETIEAIRTGQIDALVVEGDGGNKLYTLKTADQAYRVFIEKNDGRCRNPEQGRHYPVFQYAVCLNGSEAA